MATKMTKEEAINKVRQMSLPKETMEILQALAPELAESEDERIREELKEAFEAYDIDSTWNGIPIRSIFAWLEKQKEQKPVEIHVDNPNIEKFDPDVKITTSDSSADGKELLYVCNKSYDIGFRDGVASVKSAEKQDYSGLNDLERAIHRGFLCAGVENVPIAIIKETANECLAQMKPAEWSEEDEKDMAHIIRILDDCYVYGTHDLSKTDRENLVNKLKSLRPQPHWKPSEEQMKAFSSYIKDFQEKAEAAVGGWNNFDVMIRLYEQLKKL